MGTSGPFPIPPRGIKRPRAGTVTSRLLLPGYVAAVALWSAGPMTTGRLHAEAATALLAVISGTGHATSHEPTITVGLKPSPRPRHGVTPVRDTPASVEPRAADGRATAKGSPTVSPRASAPDEFQLPKVDVGTWRRPPALALAPGPTQPRQRGPLVAAGGTRARSRLGTAPRYGHCVAFQDNA